MADRQLRVTFEPTGRAVFVLPGTKMLEAAARAGLTIETPCGGAGTCGKCRLKLTAGACEPTPAEAELLSKAELADGWRLACQTAVCEQTVATIPPGSLFASQQRILTETQGPAADVSPGLRKVYVELSRPDLADPRGDLMRLEKQIGRFDAELKMVRRLPRLLRDSGFKGTAVLVDDRLIDFEAGDTTEECYGAAFDIGTTTLVAALLELRTGKERALASRINPQVAFGDDVISRIKYASASPVNLEELRRTITAAAAEMIDELCRQASIRREHIYELAFAGNTTMEHLLCGIDVEQLGQPPFTPAHGRGLAVDLGLEVRVAVASVAPIVRRAVVTTVRRAMAGPVNSGRQPHASSGQLYLAQAWLRPVDRAGHHSNPSRASRCSAGLRSSSFRSAARTTFRISWAALM